eukprot:7802046-Pyramimonas_sp.AAC.1
MGRSAHERVIASACRNLSRTRGFARISEPSASKTSENTHGFPTRVCSTYPALAFVRNRETTL